MHERLLSLSDLPGEDLSSKDVKKWFWDEAEGYYQLSQSQGKYRYVYHALNRQYGFESLPKRDFKHVLAIGGAYGHELLPIKDRIDEVVILEPCTKYKEKSVLKNSKYVFPTETGGLPFRNESFDLVTCFGVLHHIAQPSTVAKDMYRCLKPKGNVLIREPVVYMGDELGERPGMTKRERGIPLELLRKTIEDSGLEIQRADLCIFSVVRKAARLLGKEVYNDKIITWLDSKMCELTAASYRHKTENALHKIRPTSAFFVCSKS